MAEFWFHHGGVSVPNLEDALRWYRDVLGFELEYRRPLPSVPCEMAMVRNGALRMELFEVPGAKPPAEDRTTPDADLRTYGNKHVCFLIADVASFADELRRRGADIVWVKVPPKGSNIFIRDHAGNLIEFVQDSVPDLPAATLR